MNRMAFTILVLFALAGSCWSDAMTNGTVQWDEVPCPENAPPCLAYPDAKCKLICFINASGQQECENQYYDRVFCEVK